LKEWVLNIGKMLMADTYLDSLIPKSLYWENFVSNGRTFGALPSILGSLPYGEKDF
jgi:hypothetical protein